MRVKYSLAFVYVVIFLASCGYSHQKNLSVNESIKQSDKPLLQIPTPIDTFKERLTKVINALANTADPNSLIRARDFSPNHRSAKYYFLREPIPYLVNQYLINDTTRNAFYTWEYWASVEFDNIDSVKASQLSDLLSLKILSSIDTLSWTKEKSIIKSKDENLVVGRSNSNSKHVIHLIKRFEPTSKTYFVTLYIR